MGAVTSSGLDLITGALRNIGVQAAGEPVDATDANDALQVLNDLLESLSTDKDFVYSSNYNKLAWNPGQYVYSIGNPVVGTFSGNTTAGSPFITNVTATLGFTTGIGSNGVVIGGTLTDTAYAIPRPLRIRAGYTRITASGNTGLDYWFDVMNFDDYNQIGYKGVPGPWPYFVSLKTDFPLAHLFVYPAPQQSGEVHFYTDVILADLTST